MLRHYITAGSDSFSLNKEKQSFLYLYAAFLPDFLPDLPIIYHLYMPPPFFLWMMTKLFGIIVKSQISLLNLY